IGSPGVALAEQERYQSSPVVRTNRRGQHPMRQFEHFSSLTALFFIRAAEGGERPFLWDKRDDVWTPRSWSAVAREVSALAAGLKAHGVRPGDRVMLVSENRPEFCIRALAI